MIEELEQKYDEMRGVIDVLPVNTKYNRKRKTDYIDDQIENDNKMLVAIKKEIDGRLAYLNNLQVNEDIAKLEEQVEKCNISNEWNEYNTAYEKMHLDYYLYQLHRYYKDDLDGVNECIGKIIEAFKRVSVDLTVEDFDFSIEAAEYMKKIFDKAPAEELKTSFEEIYWKNSDIIKIIEINFKSIYLKYEKKITKYFSDRRQEFLKKHSDIELIEMKAELNGRLKRAKATDPYLIFQKFLNHEYLIKDFTESEIEKRRSIYFTEDNYSFDNLIKISGSLDEYNMLLKYNYLLLDMRARLEKKDEFKNALQNSLKEIAKDEKELKKLVAKKKPKKFFFKKKNDEKWLFDYNTLLDSISSKYDALDDLRFNELVYTELSKDSTVHDVLKFIASNYLYFVERTKALEDGSEIDAINDNYEILKSEMYMNNNYMLINNLALLDEKQIKQIIADKYKLENINLPEEVLQPENLEKTIADINCLINYEYYLKSKINAQDVDLYMEYSKLVKE